MTTTVPDKYGEQLSQLEPWNDMFDIIVTRHSLNSSAQRRMGRGGTFPTAVIGDRIVKLFPEFLFVPLCYEAELVAYELLWQATDLPVPQLLATGSSNETGNGWHWPYVVLTVIDGVDLTSCKSELSQESWINLAHWLGGVVKELHAMEHNKSWLAFKSFMQEQRSVTASRHRQWATMPLHLIDEIDSWLPSVNELIDTSMPPAFVHADIHEDHIFGNLECDDFTPTGIIDFGDVVFGSPMYELPALHLGTFHGDKRLLKLFLNASAMPFDPRIAMAYTLLFEFNVLTEVEIPSDLDSLDELTTWLYAID